MPQDRVAQEMKSATTRLLRKGNVKAICLGCAGMSGMDSTVRDACIQELGEAQGEEVRIVDGINAAVELMSANSITP